MNNKRNSVIILAKGINMDNEYHNIIDYHESDIVSLCESNSHLVAKQINYSFLKIGENIINVGIPYATCLEANYIAMQNPYYSNKWFFAFIDRVEYNSEVSTNIYYTVDEISTWWDYWTKNKKSFVIREHVNDDTVGLHTIPEGLETGYYISNTEESLVFNDYHYVIQATGSDEHPFGASATNVNGLFQPGGFQIWHDYANYASAIETIEANQYWTVLNAYMVPTLVLGLDTPSYNGTWGGKTTPIFTSKTLTTPATLDSYSPVNNKLKCYPYRYLLETNSSGASNTFKYESFTTTPSFSIGGTATVGASIISVPNNYKEGIELNMLTCSKFPTSAWNTDAYKSWLNQQGINTGKVFFNAEQVGYGIGGASLALGVGATLLGGGTIGAGLISSGIKNITDTMVASEQAKSVPDSWHGNLNNGDFMTASGKNGFYFYHMSIKKEYAESLDQYFTKFGYKVNTLKVPNFTGRAYFNYIQISSDDVIGNSNASITVPETSMDIINNVFRRGTTIWHNHDNIGNYNLSNTINS